MTDLTEAVVLRQRLRTLYSYALGQIPDAKDPKTTPVGQRYAAIAGTLSRWEREGVLRDEVESGVSL